MRGPRFFGRLRNEAGMTLAELIMASFIGLVVLGVMFGAVASQGRSAMHQAGLADAQSSSRGAGEILQQDLRMAGFGMLGVQPTAPIQPIQVNVVGGTTTITLYGAFSNTQTTLALGAARGANTITVAPPTPNEFIQGELVLVDSGLNSEIRTITGTNTVGGNRVLSLSAPLQYQYPIGPNVTQIERVTYQYDGTVLRRNEQVVTDNASAFDLDFIDQAGTFSETTPGESLRSVVLDLTAAQPETVPGNKKMSSRVATEVNVRNLAFRFDLGATP